jgi:hypothetical protein
MKIIVSNTYIASSSISEPVMTAGFCESNVCFVILLSLFITKWVQLIQSIFIWSCV